MTINNNFEIYHKNKIFKAKTRIGDTTVNKSDDQNDLVR